MQAVVYSLAYPQVLIHEMFWLETVFPLAYLHSIALEQQKYNPIKNKPCCKLYFTVNIESWWN